MSKEKWVPKVGDRVRVYGWVRMHHQPYHPRVGGKATIVWVSRFSNKNFHVKFDSLPSGSKEDKVHYEADFKQCRRLIKKPRRRIWVKFNEYENLWLSWSSSEAGADPGSIEFVEVRRK